MKGIQNRHIRKRERDKGREKGRYTKQTHERERMCV